MDIGLEAISFHTTEHYIDLVDLANARGIEPEKFTKGIGQKRMSIASPCEDSVHLAINAAFNALSQFDIDPSEIGSLVVGTETGVDHSKPVSIYVHHALGLPSNCLTYETKHACFGAMAAISSASDWIVSGRAKGKKALIIATDIANYEVGSAGEPTQGAGAVAMVVSDCPTLIEFIPEISGNYAKNVMDFWRPLYLKEAIADGHYSIECYLDSLSACLGDAGVELPRLSELSACLYHVPFSKMATKAHLRHYQENYKVTIEKGSSEFIKFQESYQSMTQPWLSLNADIGNIYTGSIFLSLIDLLRQGRLSSGGLVSMFSYGSGCSAAISIFRLSKNYQTLINKLDPSSEIELRRRLKIEDYEKLMASRGQLIKENGLLDPDEWGLSGRFLYLGNKEHIRQYSDLT